MSCYVLRKTRYTFMDVLIALAILNGANLLEQFAVTYDVMCMWIRNVLERMSKTFPDAVPHMKKALCCLPSFHAHGHREQCQITYSLPYSEGFGRHHGEGVEPPWAKLGPAGAATCEMMGGHRHDKLDGQVNFFNLEKRENEGVFHSRHH